VLNKDGNSLFEQRGLKPIGVTFWF